MGRRCSVYYVVRQMRRTKHALLGFFVAPAIGAILFPAFMDGSVGVFLHTYYFLGYTYSVLAAYAQTLVIGVPAYLILRDRFRYSLYTVCFIAIVVAVAPWVVIIGVPLDQAGTIMYGGILICGFVGGYVFYVITRGTHELPA